MSDIGPTVCAHGSSMICTCMEHSSVRYSEGGLFWEVAIWTCLVSGPSAWGEGETRRLQVQEAKKVCTILLQEERRSHRDRAGGWPIHGAL